MVERRKPQLRAEREARLAEALRRNLRRRKDASAEGQTAAEEAGALPAGVDAAGRPGSKQDER
ncbi:MAG: hypothetical protein KIS68_07640 [Bauldia sp.]|nr:hypothetical protein [Bauldia sp.]